MTVSDKNPDKPFPADKNDELSTRAHQRLIGVVGMMLPVLLWLLAGQGPIGEYPWVPLGSVSAYYYTGAVSAFAGMLIALALFFFSYRGYKNEYYVHDRAAAIIAGSAAVLVAFSPTAAPNGSLAFSWWTRRTGMIHLLSAVVLFGSFIFFCLFQFPISDVDNAELPEDKKSRNRIYIFCGMAMAVCMLWVIKALCNSAPIFLPEVLALELFGLSWLVKGHAYETVVAAGQHSLYYAHHPRHLVKKVLSVVGSQRAMGPTTTPQNNV